MPLPLGYSASDNPANADLDALWAVANAAAPATAAVAATVAAVSTVANTASANATTALSNSAIALNTLLPVFNVRSAPYGAVGNGTADDTTAIQAASTACDAAGGGILFFPAGRYKITSAVTATRKVCLVGAGPNVTMILAASILQLKIKGTAVGWGGNTVEGITFSKVDLILGEANTDQMQGVQVVNCTFLNGTYGIYFGWNCFFTLVDRCKMVDCTYGSFVDATTAGTSSGAMMRWRTCEIHDSGATGLAHYGIVLSGAAAGGYELLIDQTEFERLTIAGVVVIGGTNRSAVTITHAHFELMGTGEFHIINDGAIVRLDGFWSFSATEAALVKSTGGRTMLSNGFVNWTSTHFALVTGGIVAVDQDSIYSPSRWWGPNMQNLWYTGSTVGGSIVTMRSPVRGWMFLTSGSLTDGAPAAAAVAVAMPGDGNNRVYECLVTTTVVTTDNTVRFNFTDGTHNVNCDLIMPLFVGTARVRLTWNRGTSIRAEGIFSGSAPGATTTKGIDSGAVTDTIVNNAITYLNISTTKSSTTCATLTVSDIQELVYAPFTADT